MLKPLLDFLFGNDRTPFQKKQSRRHLSMGTTYRSASTTSKKRPPDVHSVFEQLNNSASPDTTVTMCLADQGVKFTGFDKPKKVTGSHIIVYPGSAAKNDKAHLIQSARSNNLKVALLGSKTEHECIRVTPGSKRPFYIVDVKNVGLQKWLYRPGTQPTKTTHHAAVIKQGLVQPNSHVKNLTPTLDDTGTNGGNLFVASAKQPVTNASNHRDEQKNSANVKRNGGYL